MLWCGSGFTYGCVCISLFSKGVTVEEIDVDLGEDMPQPMEKVILFSGLYLESTNL